MSATKAPLVASAPWPIRLFGDFQFFLGMPAVVTAVDLRTAVSAVPRNDEMFALKAPWRKKPFVAKWEDITAGGNEESVFAGALRAAASRGFRPESGYDFEIMSRAPWREALPDSPAVAAALTVCLLDMAGKLEALTGNEIAQAAAAAYAGRPPTAQPIPEVYAAVLGGTSLVLPTQPPDATAVERVIPGILCARIPGTEDDSVKVTQRIMKLLEALAEFAHAHPDFNLRTGSMDDLIPRLRAMSDSISMTAYSQVVLRDLCVQALQLLENEHGLDDDRLGELLDGTHEMLRDYIGYNLPKMEEAITAAVGGGALGCKVIPGAAGFVCLAPGREEAVAKAIREVGGEVHTAAVSDGARIEHVDAARGN